MRTVCLVLFSAALASQAIGLLLTPNQIGQVATAIQGNFQSGFQNLNGWLPNMNGGANGWNFNMGNAGRREVYIPIQVNTGRGNGGNNGGGQGNLPPGYEWVVINESNFQALYGDNQTQEYIVIDNTSGQLFYLRPGQNPVAVWFNQQTQMFEMYQQVQFPGQQGQQVQFPGQQVQFPGQQVQFPGQQVQFPGQQGQFPGQQVQFPGQQGQFPGQQGQVWQFTPNQWQNMQNVWRMMDGFTPKQQEEMKNSPYIGVRTINGKETLVGLNENMGKELLRRNDIIRANNVEKTTQQVQAATPGRVASVVQVKQVVNKR